MLYPLKFMPVYKDYLWGGRALAEWGKTLPEHGVVAESWEVSAHPNGVSLVDGGPLDHRSLPELIREYGDRLLGKSPAAQLTDSFPLLIKLIDACDRLSVQVHPDDAYASAHAGGERGKNEMWYVVAAQPGAELIAGVRPGTTRERFARAIEEGDCLSLLQAIPVRAGDVINIPAGLVHAIGAGLIICEVQQSSDTTYRVFDYNRRDQAGHLRDLHIEQALDVIDFSGAGDSALVPGVTIRDARQPDLERRVLVINRYLKTEYWQIDGTVNLEENGSRFFALTVLSGNGQLHYPSVDGRSCSVSLKAGESVLIPAELRSWQLTGKLGLLHATISEFDRDLQELGQAAGNGDNLPDRESLIRRFSGKIGLQPLPED